MGLIKAALISGAVIYGVNKVAKTAASHSSGSNYNPNYQSTTRRDYADNQYEHRQPPSQATEFRPRETGTVREMPDQGFDNQYQYFNQFTQPHQRLYLDETLRTNGGSGADMLDMLTRHAIDRGLIGEGHGKGKKDRGDWKGEVLAEVFD
jgi:hypothetical protein